MQETGQTPSHPYFVLPVSRPVVGFGQQELCELRSADQTLELRTEDVEAVVAVCNEELVYNRLFRKRLMFALIEPDNEQSVRVVLRAQFVQEADALRNNRRLLQFAKML